MQKKPILVCLYCFAHFLIFSPPLLKVIEEAAKWKYICFNKRLSPPLHPSPCPPLLPLLPLLMQTEVNLWQRTSSNSSSGSGGGIGVGATMRSEALLLYFTLLQIAGAGFPEDSEPISISHGNCEYILISSISLPFLSLQVPPHSFSCTLLPFPCYHPLHKSSSLLLSHSFYLVLLHIPLNLCFLCNPHVYLHSMHFECLECNLAPKDRLSTHTQMKDLKQHLKRSLPHIKG